MRPSTRSRKGFTLIELLVVVVIIAILAGLLFPALSKAQKQAQARSCLAKLKSFATSIRTYAASWDGHTPPDPETYLTRDRGHKAFWEDGYFRGDDAREWYKYQSGTGATPTESQKFAAKIKDFRCPVDDSPLPNKHGIPKSYMIASAYSGDNIGSLGGDDSEIIVIGERGKRHIDESGKLYDAHYVYADMHAKLGSRHQTSSGLGVVQGLRMRVWYVNDFEDVDAVPESRLPVLLSGTPPFRYETIWSSSLKEGTPLWLACLDGYSYNDDWDLQRSVLARSFYGGSGSTLVKFPNIFTVRWDGLIRFPAPGIYDFYLEFLAVKEGAAWVSFGIGHKGDYVDPTNFDMHTEANDPNRLYSVTIATNTAAEDYYPLKMLYRGGQWNGPWKITWTRRDTVGNPDPQIRNRVVDARHLFHIPQ